MSEATTKIKEATKEVCSLYDRVTSGLSANMEQLDTHEVYEIADIIKDLAEAKKYLVECAYKEQIMEAMEESDYDENGRMGYRGRRADGRFVHRAGPGRNAGGYTPQEFWLGERTYPMNYGYTPDMMNNSNNSNGGTSGYKPEPMSERGVYYDNYRKARRYYTESHTEQSQHEMREKMKQNFQELRNQMSEMWADMDAQEKVKYKEELLSVMK